MGLTIEIKRSLEAEEYSDPSKVRALMKSGEFSPSEFRSQLFSAILAAFPCPKEKEIPQSLTAAKQKLWEQFARENPTAERRDFILDKCMTGNLCKQCSCKKELISFFEKISSDSADTIRHRITSWLSGKVRKLDRITYIQLCFALNMRIFPSGTQLSEEEKLHDANRFLTLACKQPPLYTINPAEAVYYYCLANPGDRGNAENWKYACGLCEKAESVQYDEDAEEDVYTMYAVSALEKIISEDELLEFIAKNRLDSHELHYTARENCRSLFEQFEESAIITRSIEYGTEKEAERLKKEERNRKDAEKRRENEEEGKSQRKPHKQRTAPKAISCEVLEAIELFDETGELDSRIIEALRTYGLGDILHSSDRLDAIISGEEEPDRTILLLTLLALNCACCYNEENNTLDESDEFTDMPSFTEYFNLLSTSLRAMAMAPLYPRWRMDFVVLYSYHLIRKDALAGRIPDALSEYMIKAFNLIAGGKDNA